MSLPERLALGSADDIEVALRRIYEWRPLTPPIPYPPVEVGTTLRRWQLILSRLGQVDLVAMDRKRALLDHDSGIDFAAADCKHSACGS
jgi:hypothetical protein